MGCEYAISKVRDEYFNGLRPDWVPAPTINVECRNAKNVSAFVRVIHPNGNPWANREFALKITTKDKAMKTIKDLKVVPLVTSEQGEASFSYELSGRDTYERAWVEVVINKSTWLSKVSS